MKSLNIYILECADGSYYIGHTDNLETRFEQHVLGQKLVYSQGFEERDQAKQVEKQVKGWFRAKKKVFIDKDFEILKKFKK